MAALWCSALHSLMRVTSADQLFAGIANIYGIRTFVSPTLVHIGTRLRKDNLAVGGTLAWQELCTIFRLCLDGGVGGGGGGGGVGSGRTGVRPPP